jgi:UDP-4-amino-4,6-dideoxy-N-acetyl-beta-L-altrosamine transaminase
MIPYGHQFIDQADIDAVVKVLKSDRVTTGPKVAEFEKALGDKVGSKDATSVNSGTSALDISVQALGLPPGSEVITTPFTFVATSNAILYNDLKPVFADIDPGARNIDPESIKKKITKSTKAIIYVDYAGQPCRIREIKEIADDHDLRLIEDACHALGAEYRGRRVGTFADMTVFSFHPVKHITTGEGGAVTTNNEDLDRRLKMLRNHGISREPPEGAEEGLDYIYDVKALGRNYRITDLQCALGISQIAKLESFVKKRTQLANLYNRILKDVKSVDVPIVDKDVKHAWHLYTVLLNGLERNKFFKYMRANGIGVQVHYIPIYRFSYYRERFNIEPKEFPVTEDVFKRIVTLPLHPQLKDQDIELICDKIKAYPGNKS